MLSRPGGKGRSQSYNAEREESMIEEAKSGDRRVKNLAEWRDDRIEEKVVGDRE